VSLQPRWVIASLAGVVVVYSVVVLSYVATSPDLRLRFFLVDASSLDGDPSLVGRVGRDTAVNDSVAVGLPTDEGITRPGIVLQYSAEMDYRGPQRPQRRDVLLSVGRKATPTFMHFVQEMAGLRNAPLPPGGKVSPNADPWELPQETLPPLLEEGVGLRWVITEWRSEAGEVFPCWLRIQSLPLGDLSLSLAWFVLLLGVFSLGGVVYWHRPSDRTSKLFFVICMLTLSSFVGGYHWWVVAGSLWLTVPYIVASTILPGVLLHFVLIFPKPKRLIARHTRLALIGVYCLPVISAAVIVGLVSNAAWLTGISKTDAHATELIEALSRVEESVYGALAASAVCFLIVLGVVHNSYVGTRNSLERGQLRWIWRSGLAALFVTVFAWYLALNSRLDFTLGAGRACIFLTASSVGLAYAAGVIRFRLMLVEQIISKGVLYYVVTYGLTMLFGIAIALGTLMPRFMNTSLSSQQVLSAAAVATLSAVMLLWLRDRVQRGIDRQFFREKYQLDKALRRMNRAVSRIGEPEALAEMMLGQCRDVLTVDRAALYLRSGTLGPFPLISAYGIENVTMQLSLNDEFIEALSGSGCLQRVTPGSRSEMSPVQQVLRMLDVEMVHAIEVDDGIAGLVLLGAKKSGTLFTAEDLTFLNALGHITNVALHSAKVDQDIARLNEELRLKVDTITEQQRQLAMLRIEQRTRRHDERIEDETHGQDEFRRDVIIGNSPAIQQVLTTVRKVATSESSVLIRGESGTGKELLAQILHENGSRHSGPLVSVHCASLSPSLLESELFGHVKGAFTGAHRDRVGRFELAMGGTLFLDEIGDISLDTQVKLLRVLQERSFEPVGGTRTVNVDVRLITATHQNLERLIEQGRFREDLFYRLNVISVRLPPLRERMEDVFELALHFLNRSSNRMGKRITRFSEDVLSMLERHIWPGNVRELENVIERAVVMADTEEISMNDLPDELVRNSETDRSELVVETKLPTSGSVTYVQPTQADTAPLEWQPPPTPGVSEREMLERALRDCGGNKAKAARAMGLPRSTYYSKLKKHSIE